MNPIIHLCVLYVVQAHLQHYTEPSTDPTPAASALSNTLLPLGPGTLTHNVGGVPIIVACTKADLIDEGNDVIGAGASGMGGMVKGKGGEWEERTDGIMQILRTVCLKCTHLLLIEYRSTSLRWDRWCRSVLHNTASAYYANSQAIYASLALCAACATTRHGGE